MNKIDQIAQLLNEYDESGAGAVTGHNEFGRLKSNPLFPKLIMMMGSLDRSKNDVVECSDDAGMLEVTFKDGLSISIGHNLNRTAIRKELGVPPRNDMEAGTNPQRPV